MLWNEILSAVCICCSSIIFSFSLLKNCKLKLLFFQRFASILYISSYLFILFSDKSALVGALTAVFEMIRLLVFYFIEKNEKYNTKKNNIIAMIVFSIILTICTCFLWSGWISLFPLISAIIVSIALGLKNLLIIKISHSIQAAFISTYLLYLSLWINAASQIYVFIVSIISVILYLKNNKRSNNYEGNQTL